jgi:predicted anti-sigma-YlaC factor YlaD
MKILSWIVAAAAVVAFVSLPAGVVLAQTTPNTGPETITGAPSAVAPAATTTTPAAAPTTTTATEPAKSPKKKKVAKMTRQQEIDKSIDRGTVPARYRNSVPKEYQQYVPFEKR